ncbi:dihydrolipoyl dehydrogenase [uncultured Prevotella sp.]|uniref:dihydrolipoyl dehydrogenase n=1 Tax=uncultured Prevotella sp. TaxID=159272 RepID=UPI002638C782|nr:dihydrolipoyl dehydrogenase [uncultured Prevotella sp.]
MENSFDIIIIGGGPGGYKTATYAASKGLTVLVVEKAELGGTCLNCGCIPTKTYARNAEIIQTLKEADVYGLDELSFSFNFKTAYERKNNVIDALRNGISTLLSAPGITVVKGEAVLKSASSVSVNGEEYSAKNIIIATGSESKTLPIAGLDADMICDSTWLLSTDILPKRICIVGAGVIGMEFASILNSFGCEVSVVEFLKECLPALDGDIAKRLRKCLEKRGVAFYMQSGLKSAAKGKVVFEKKGKETELETEKVLLAVGRKPNVEGLGLDEVGIAYDKKGITVTDMMQTSVSGVYAIGDVNGRQMLAHAAEMQGKRAVNSILGLQDDIRFDIMPAAIFTNPEAACVGKTEEQLKAEGMEYICQKHYYRANGKALAMNETEGMLKLLADKNGLIIGCHVYGAHAADLVQEVSVLMCRNTTLQQLHDMTHIHPTLSEIIVE